MAGIRLMLAVMLGNRQTKHHMPSNKNADLLLVPCQLSSSSFPFLSAGRVGRSPSRLSGAKPSSHPLIWASALVLHSLNPAAHDARRRYADHDPWLCCGCLACPVTGWALTTLVTKQKVRMGEQERGPRGLGCPKSKRRGGRLAESIGSRFCLGLPLAVPARRK